MGSPHPHDPVPAAEAGGPPHVVEEAEGHRERLNRELDQLLQEIRVALPGVQVLFAFLLTVAFADRFGEVDADGQQVYVAAITLAALATVLLVAPTVHHRLRFRDGTKEEMIRTGNVLALAGVTCLGLAIGCAVYVVGDAAFSRTPARWIGPGVVLLAFVVWFVLPLRFRGGRTPGSEGRSTGVGSTPP